MAPGVRARARAETTRMILEEARRQLAQQGAAALSLRSVAREIGMVSSAVYRYVASREELLTRLIVEAYDAVGQEAETACDAHEIPREQWRAVWFAVRAWALEHPAEYALLYGSPVPGYAAPDETIPAASRVGRVLAGIVTRHAEFDSKDSTRLDGLIEDAVVSELSPEAAVATVAAWTELFGTVSFEVFGQYQNVVGDRDGYFKRIAELAADSVGLPLSTSPSHSR